MTKWKLVPVKALEELRNSVSGRVNMGSVWEAAVIDSMLEAAPQPPKSKPIAYIEHHKGGDNLVWDNPGGKYSVLYTAPLVMKLSDERILEIYEEAKANWNAQADQCNQWSDLGVDEVVTLVARAVEREILGGAQS